MSCYVPATNVKFNLLMIFLCYFYKKKKDLAYLAKTADFCVAVGCQNVLIDGGQCLHGTDKARQMGYRNVANVADQEALRS